MRPLLFAIAEIPPPFPDAIRLGLTKGLLDYGEGIRRLREHLSPSGSRSVSGAQRPAAGASDGLARAVNRSATGPTRTTCARGTPSGQHSSYLG